MNTVQNLLFYILIRLSQNLNIKQTDETAYITNPDDEDRPTRLAERFAIVYEEEWNDAFDALNMTLRWGEMDAIFHLLRIVRVHILLA